LFHAKVSVFRAKASMGLMHKLITGAAPGRNHDIKELE
jgi:hypothetical protein